MPITIKHGEGLEGLAALVALMTGAGRQQAPQAPQMSNLIGYSGGGGGGGGGGGVRRAPSRWGGQVAPPGEPTEEERLRTEMQMKLRGERFGIPIEEERMRMEQEMKANGWKLEYSAESKKSIAKGNESLRRINEGVRSGMISPKEGEAMRQAVTQEMMGAPETWTPPDPNQEIFPPGQGPRDIWPNEITGDYMGYDRNGNQVVRIPYEKTPEGRKETHEQNVELEELKARQKTREAMADYRKELLKERVPTAEKGKERPLQPNEVQERMEAAYPKEMAEEFRAFLQERQAAQQEEQAPLDAELEQELQQRVDTRQGAMEQLQSWAQRMKVEPTEAEAGLPDEVALAQAFLRNANERIKKGEKVFPHITEAYDAALEILEGHNARGNR